MNNFDWKTPTLAAVFGIGLATTAAANCADHLDAGAELWIEPQDSPSAFLEPDCYAWQLFVALNWPGDPATQAADATKALGDDGATAWELWRIVHNNAANTVFAKNGSDPGPWLIGATPQIARPVSNFEALPLQQLANLEGFAMPEIDSESPFGNETRMNKDSYDFVRDNTLYNREGQQAAFDPVGGVIEFPPNAKEIKARWRIISDAEKPQYHWVEVELPDGSIQPFGLTSLHITTKDLPNWFWATFEHVDNELSGSRGGVPGHEGWRDPSRDSYACPNNPNGCDQSPAVVAGTKWENYRLRGTQIDFVDSRGKPTILASSVIEQSFQNTSSCITCHARASYDAAGQFHSIFKSTRPLVGFVGAPDPDWFFREVDAEIVTHTQTDFVWSLSRACPTAPPAPRRCQ